MNKIFVCIVTVSVLSSLCAMDSAQVQHSVEVIKTVEPHYGLIGQLQKRIQNNNSNQLAEWLESIQDEKQRRTVANDLFKQSAALLVSYNKMMKKPDCCCFKSRLTENVAWGSACVASGGLVLASILDAGKLNILPLAADKALLVSGFLGIACTAIVGDSNQKQYTILYNNMEQQVRIQKILRAAGAQDTSVAQPQEEESNITFNIPDMDSPEDIV